MYCTSNRTDILIFWNDSFGDEQENGDGLAKAAPRDAGMVTSGQTVEEKQNDHLAGTQCFEMYFKLAVETH